MAKDVKFYEDGTEISYQEVFDNYSIIAYTAIACIGILGIPSKEIVCRKRNDDGKVHTLKGELVM